MLCAGTDGSFAVNAVASVRGRDQKYALADKDGRDALRTSTGTGVSRAASSSLLTSSSLHNQCIDRILSGGGGGGRRRRHGQRRGKEWRPPKSLRASTSQPGLPFARFSGRNNKGCQHQNFHFDRASHHNNTKSLPKLDVPSIATTTPVSRQFSEQDCDSSVPISSGEDSDISISGGRPSVQRHGGLPSESPATAGIRRTAPGGIWLCPITASLREEAGANLAAMTKPTLWRSSSGVSLREAAKEELEFLKGRFKAIKKQREPRATVLDSLRAEMTEDVRERWMKRRAFMRTDRFTVQQRRELRKWFDSLDRDGSGEIDSCELSHPLLSTGLARSAQEVQDLVKHVDRDGSGEIGFPEFLAILQPRGSIPTTATAADPSKAPSDAVNKIVKLQEVKMMYGGDMSTVVVIERRSLLMKEIVDEAAFRDLARDDVANKRYLAERDGDYRALRALRARERRLEVRRVKKNLFIQAVSDATDFTKEREEINMTMLGGYKQDLHKKEHVLPSQEDWRFTSDLRQDLDQQPQRPETDEAEVHAGGQKMEDIRGVDN